MKFKIPCPTSLLSIVLVICGAILSDNLQAMSPAASAARQNVLKNLQARITGEEYASDIQRSTFFTSFPRGSILGLTAANVAASGVALPATVSSTPIVGTNASKPAQGFSLMDLAIQNTIRAGTPTGDSGSAMLFDLLYFGAPAYSFANKNQPGAYGTRLSKSMGLPFVLPSAGAHVGTLYHAIKAGNISSACAVVATDPNLQIAGNDVNSFWLGASCTSTSGCCGNNVCKNGVCDTGSAPAACTASSCGVGNYCNVAGSCVAGCLTAANCASGYNCVSGSCVLAPVVCVNPLNGECALPSAPCCSGSVCDLTNNNCYTSGAGQIPGADAGCFSNADCASGSCTVNSGPTPGSCQKVVTCIPGTATGAIPSSINECTPFNDENLKHTVCCAGGYTCYTPNDGSYTYVCQTCVPKAVSCSANDNSGTGADRSCCSGQCADWFCQ